MGDTKWITLSDWIYSDVSSVKLTCYISILLKTVMRMVVLNIIVLQESIFKLKDTIIREKNLNFNLPDYALFVNADTQIIERQALGKLLFTPGVIVPVISSNKTERKQGSLLIDCTDSQRLFLLLKKQTENR